MAYLSPLRYPGGKRKLANYFKLVFRYNQLMDGCYIEPYAGGSAIALELLFSEYVSRIIINDYSKPIYAFWYSVLYETDALCNYILDVNITMNEWYKQKDIYSQTDEKDLLELGFATLFLNRTNRSGILGGGVIGGKDQKGIYKIDARFNKQTIVQRIRRIARYRDRIDIYNKDAIDFIVKIQSTVPQRTLLYLDPPYYRKGRLLYENHYNHLDHVQIAEMLATINSQWIISYDNVAEIRELYPGYPNITYGLHYSASKRYQGQEVMFFHENLFVPPIREPAKIDSKRLINWLVQFRVEI